VAAGLFFQDLGRYPLSDPDEARHAEVAREMAVARGWRHLFLPTLELRPYSEKPPTFYWLVGEGYRMLGVDAAGARVTSACAAWITVLALYLWAVPRFGVAGALGAGLVAATSAGWFALARYVNLDMTFTACVTLGVLAGLAWLDRPAPRPPPRAPFVAAAAAVLVKGPLGLVLVAGPLLLAAIGRRPRPTLRELDPGPGILIFAGIVLLGFAPIAFLDPAMLRGFLMANVRRFGAASPHAAPFWFYALWLPALFLPWTIVAGPSLVAAARDPKRRELVWWAVFVPAVLTLARGKLPTYVLPALPPLALLVGPALARVVREGPSPGERSAMGVSGAIVAIALAAGAIAAVVAGRAYPVGVLGRSALALAALGWAAAAFSVLREGRIERVPLLVLGAALTLYPIAVRTVAPAVGALRSDRDAAVMVRAAGGAPVIAFGAWAPSLVFYTGAPTLRTDDPRIVRDLFEAAGPTFLITGKKHVAEVEALLGDRAHLWHATARRRLYGNRPPPPGDAVLPGSP
jgi:4-amino-4-deoxy-L-arabinose transferase-like glycosyltransferase